MASNNGLRKNEINLTRETFVDEKRQIMVMATIIHHTVIMAELLFGYKLW